MKLKTKAPKLMSGSLWFIKENENPSTLKEFKNTIDKNEPTAQLSRGNIIPKNKKIQQRLIFDCFRPKYEESLSFRLFLYEDGKVQGKIEYPIHYDASEEYFKGNYKLNSKSKISVWGKWSEDKDYKKTYLIYIELTR